MPKGLVVHLDYEIYKRFRMMYISEGETLKDQAYELIKETVKSYVDFLEDNFYR